MPPIAQFRSNLAYVRNLLALHAAWTAQTTGALDLSDLLRAALVQIVSALDRYVHERVIEGMVDVFRGRRPVLPEFDAFPLPISIAMAGSRAPLTDAQLRDAIRRILSVRTCQRPDKISEALGLISSARIWRRIAHGMRVPSRVVQTRLNLIIDRRNQIAHEADLDPSNPGVRWPIAITDVQRSVDFVERMVEAIDRMI